MKKELRAFSRLNDMLPVLAIATGALVISSLLGIAEYIQIMKQYRVKRANAMCIWEQLEAERILRGRKR